MAANPDDSIERLVERSADLKAALTEFAQGRRFRRALADAFDIRLGATLVADEGELTNALDYFLLQHRLDDDRTVVEHFVDTARTLSAAERALLLGWREVVEGVFAIRRRDGDVLILHNLVDELTYRARSNAGPAVFAQLPVGSFLIARLVPVGDDWLLSGAQQVFPRSARRDVYRLAAELALQVPRLAFRNPATLARAWELQREDRAAFVAFFGSDTVVLPGPEVPDRIRRFHRFRLEEWRGPDGTTMAERAKADQGKARPIPDLDLPDELLAAETVGIIYDEAEGMNFFPDFGLVAAVFAAPELVEDRRHRDAVRYYLEESGIIPLPLQRLADQHPDHADRVFARLLRRRDFSWRRDGEALLRRYKPEAYREPPTPGIAPLGDALVQALTGGSPERRIGRNDPCPCGSGKKFKRCCGA